MKQITFEEFQKLNQEGFIKINKAIISLGIKWWAHSGTLIGVVRENGFLSWDDDIDMGMAIDDYLKYLEDLNKIAEENNYYFADRFKNIGMTVSRFIYKEKFIISYEGKKYVSSPFIDIMIAIPFKKENKLKFKIWEWQNKYFFLFSSLPPVLPKIDTRYGRVRKLHWYHQLGSVVGQILLFWTIPLFYLQNYWLKKKAKNIKKYKNLILFHSYTSRFFIYRKDQLIERKILNGKAKIYISKFYIKELNASFGKNWTKKPPIEKQIPHHIIYNPYNPKKEPKIYPHIVK
ncbi:LicD family protein [Candidatus Hepatoplasma crinochetorum]|uniref:LicD family protein n=1 Tax=Candidatus Hepatoplasma crinochetorum TaxID=295596 RepID=UPI00308FBC9F|nr:MAG: hypothetical protein HCTKY_0410 [Candidatus Hepatoplasma crinochetorum]